MACIVPTPADLAEVYSNERDLTVKGHDDSHISENIQELNDGQVAHGQERKDVEEDVGKNLRDTCDVFMSSSEKSCYYNQEKIENIEAFSRGFNKIQPNIGINLNESSKENELRVEVIKPCDTDNNSNTVKKMLRKSLSLVGSNSTKEIDLDETLSRNSIVDDEYHSGSFEYLQIMEHKNNLKNKSLREIVDSESEEDTQTRQCNDYSQTDYHITSTTVSNYIMYKHHHCYNFLMFFTCQTYVNNI